MESLCPVFNSRIVNPILEKPVMIEQHKRRRVTPAMFQQYVKQKMLFHPKFNDSGAAVVYIYDHHNHKVLSTTVMETPTRLSRRQLQSVIAQYSDFLTGAFFHTHVTAHDKELQHTAHRLHTEIDVGKGVSWMMEAGFVSGRWMFSYPRMVCDASDIFRVCDHGRTLPAATVSPIKSARRQ